MVMNRLPRLLRVISLSVALLLFLGSTTGCTRTRKGELDINSKKVLVTVNGEPVREGDVNRRILAAHGQVDRQRMGPTQRQMMLEAATETEIIDRLILQAAAAEGMTVPDSEIDAALQRTKEMTGKKNFKKMLKERRVSEKEFRNFLRDRQIIDQYKDKLFSAVSLDAKRVRSYYRGHKKQFTAPDLVRLELFSVQKQETAQEILKKWKEGKSFEDLVQAYSFDKNKPIGRRLRWISYDSIPPELREHVRAEKTGRILGPLQGSDGIYVIKIVEKRKAGLLPYDEVKGAIEANLRQKEESKILEAWYEEQKKKADIQYTRP